MQNIDLEVKETLKALLDQLAPKNMPKNEIAKLRKAAGLGESTIRNARKRESLSGDTLIRLMLVNGIQPADILSLPRSSSSESTAFCPTLIDWNKLGLELTAKERKTYSNLVNWGKEHFSVR